MAYYDPRKKMVPDYDPSGQYSDPGGFNTGVPPIQANMPQPTGPAAADDRPYGGNDALWLYNELLKQFGHQGGLLADGAYKDQLLGSVIPGLISQYGGAGDPRTGQQQNPGWMASKINELPAEAYWRLRQALGLPQLHV